tara:strand:+ start:6261 stop:7055 length:795 start_codon:yes stop_codon:yes gene_type:complete
MGKPIRDDSLYETRNYLVKLAGNNKEKEETYRLRYQIFHKELQEAPYNQSGIEKDDYDDDCDHLILIYKRTNKIIGTYRLLPWFKMNPEKGYYSQQEFQFIKIPREKIAEVGRLCIDKEYRKTNSFITLWIGLYRYAKSRKIRYLFGVNSLRKGTSSENIQKIYAYLKKHKRISKKFKAKALVPLSDLNAKDLHVPKKEFKKIAPKITNNYFKLGLRFIGEPTYDEIFQVYDLLGIFDFKSIKAKSTFSIFTFKNNIKNLLSKS